MPERLHGRQAAVALADARGDAPGHAHVGGRELDVVGDEERTSADDGGSGRGVWPRGSEVRARHRASAMASARPSKPRPTDGGKGRRVRVARRSRVQVDRQLEAIGDAFGELASRR